MLRCDYSADPQPIRIRDSLIARPGILQGMCPHRLLRPEFWRYGANGGIDGIRATPGHPHSLRQHHRLRASARSRVDSLAAQLTTVDQESRARDERLYSKIDWHFGRLDGKIDLGFDRLEVRIDSVDARQNTRVTVLMAQVQAHIERHAG